MKYLNFKNYVFLVLLALFSALVSCDLDKTEATTNLFNHYYSIEPESLLDALESGEVNVFSPITEEPPPIPPDQQIPVSWTQEDYLRIVNALFEFVWGETLSGWQLNNMDFALGCTKIDVGFQDGNFEFFKIVKTSGRESRIARIINIHPRSKIVFVTENEYYPRLVDWSSIDWDKPSPPQARSYELQKILVDRKSVYPLRMLAIYLYGFRQIRQAMVAGK